MSTYMVIDAETAEIMREGITSEQLQAADRLLQASKRLGRYQLAAAQANARDRRLRYGDSYKHPAGVVQHVPSRRRRSGFSQVIRDFMVCLGIR